MSPEVKQRLQLVLVVAVAVAAVRAGVVIYERHEENRSASEKPVLPLNPDYYVTPKKLHPYDLKSARQLIQQTAWVKEGYRYTYFPYRNHHVDFSHEAGLLLPIENLQITDVVTDVSPGSPDQRQVMAVFGKGGNTFAVPVGLEKGGDYQIYSDEMFYIEDPHELYKHWPADIWQTIGQHQVKPGMNELQADFAIGMGVPEKSSDPDVKTVNYPNGGKPLSITYRGGLAAEIRPGG